MIQINAVFDILPPSAEVKYSDYETVNGKIEIDGLVPVLQVLVGLQAQTTTNPPVLRAIITRLEILDMLQGYKCVCGQAKENMKSHCPKCYNSLSPELRRAVYRKFGNGYEAAFLISLVELADDGRTDREAIRAAVPVPKDVS